MFSKHGIFPALICLVYTSYKLTLISVMCDTYQYLIPSRGYWCYVNCYINMGHDCMECDMKAALYIYLIVYNMVSLTIIFSVLNKYLNI